MATDQIRPQTGPQQSFATTPADIVLYGGSAGSGKTWSLLLEPLRHVDNGDFGAVIFRRTYPRITNEGGLWDESKKLYNHLRGKPSENKLNWRFPSGSTISFRHLEYEKHLQDWHGAQIPLICFDELVEFTSRMFIYMLSRNRTTCGVHPYIRATCNPDGESWVYEWVRWWIGDEGYPIPERSGVIRWFIRLDETLHWFGSRDDAVQHAIGAGISATESDAMPKSFTFISAKLDDNPALLEKNPEYRANLMALPHVDRERLLGGNWKIKPNVGEMFPRSGWKFVKAPPAGLLLARGWDKAGTEGGRGARSAGVLIGLDMHTHRWFVVNAVMGRWGDIEREDTILTTTKMDAQRYGNLVCTILEQEPGSGGKDSALQTVRNLRGHDVRIERVTGEKSSRWRPFATQVQAGNVYLVDDDTWDWSEFVAELDALSGNARQDGSRLKDLADAVSLAFNLLCTSDDAFVHGAILASGDPDHVLDESRPFDDRELAELPDYLRELIDETGKLQGEEKPLQSRRDDDLVW